MKLTIIAASVAFALLPPSPAAAQQQTQQQTPQQQTQSPTADQKGSAATGGSAARGSVPVQQNQSRQDKFKSLDTNSDGKISRAEAQASPELMLIFVPTDTNSDGEISVVEFDVVPLVQPDGTAVK
jgi:Ca2+-binding EF-hand superfamily protein